MSVGEATVNAGRHVVQASVEYVMPPTETQPPNGLSLHDTIAWAIREWSQDYPQYLALYIEGGILMGGPR